MSNASTTQFAVALIQPKSIVKTKSLNCSNIQLQIEIQNSTSYQRSSDTVCFFTINSIISDKKTSKTQSTASIYLSQSNSSCQN